MKTTEINSETSNRCLRHRVALNPMKRLLAASVGALLAVSATLNAHAQSGIVYSINIVGCVPDMTTYLLTAPLTTAQRQALHAKNFNQLPASQRALYLHAAAYDVGIMVGSGQSLSSAALAEYLKSASLTGVEVAPSPELLAHKAVVKEAMRELNVLIAPQVSNNATFLQAMDSGAINSFWWYEWYD